MDRPLMAFYPGDELNHDPTNWWTPNVPALASIGRVRVHRCGVPCPVVRGEPEVFHAVKVSDAELEKRARREYMDRHLHRLLASKPLGVR